MDTSNNPGAQLLLKYVHGDISAEELALLHKYMDESPDLRADLEELSDEDNVWERFWYQHDIDTEESWLQFKKDHLIKYTPVTVVKINWWQTLLTSSAFLMMAALSLTFTSPSTNKSAVAEEHANRYSVVPDSAAKYASRGYCVLDGSRRVDLDTIPQDSIELPGLSILNQGAMFTIKNNGTESDEPRTIKLVTAGKQVKLQLPDGSRVTLNKNSSIIFPLPFDSVQRTVGLWGEGYFEVTSNPNVPFVVQLINKAIVQAYGTAFTVNCHGKDSYTTLLHGHVTVNMDGQTKTLGEEERVQTTEDKQWFVVTKVNKKAAIAWAHKNEFDLRNVGFKEMMLEVGSWYGYTVSFQGEMPQGNRSIKLNENASLDFLIETIEENDNVTIQKTTDNELRVMSK
ncbi:MAG TPA: FecR family protein [Niastella sp.]